MGSTLKVDNIVGTSGTSAPITLSGDTATLGSGVTNNAGVASGTVSSSVTFASGVFPFATLNRATNESNLNDYTVVFETITDANNILNHSSGSITFNATGTYLFFMSAYIEDSNAERRIEAFLKNGSTIYGPSRAVGSTSGAVDSDTSQLTLNSSCVLPVTSTSDTYTLFVDSDNNNTADLVDIDIQFIKMSS